MQVEKVKTKLAFLKEEVDLQSERARVDGKMQILSQSKDTAIAEAELSKKNMKLLTAPIPPYLIIST